MEAAQPSCILCGRCLDVCPLFACTQKEELAPRAKGLLLQTLSAGEDLGGRQLRKLLASCLQCERCVDVCPQQVNIAARIREFRELHPTWRSWVFSGLVRSFPLFLPRLAQWFFKARAQDGELSDVYSGSGAGRFEKRPMESAVGLAEDRPLVIFPGCVSRYAFAGWEERAGVLLAQAGREVIPRPDWQCCGFTFAAAGLYDKAVEVQQANLGHWRALGRPLVFSYCASCFKGLKQLVRSPLDWQPGEQECWLASQIFVLDFLAKYRIWGQDVQDSKICWHRSCHLEEESLDRFLCFGGQGSILDRCCGLGGSFYLEDPDTCQRVGRFFWQGVEDGSAVVTCCSGCYLQLRRTVPLGVRVLHLLEVLDY